MPRRLVFVRSNYGPLNDDAIMLSHFVELMELWKHPGINYLVNISSEFVVVQTIKKCCTFKECRGFLPRSKDPVIGSCFFDASLMQSLHSFEDTYEKQVNVYFIF